MSRIYSDITATIGRTPLVRLNRLTAGLPGTVVAKLESLNPWRASRTGSAFAMIEAAEEAACSRGHRDRRADEREHRHRAGVRRRREGLPPRPRMPETMSVERRKLLKALGAELVLTPGAEGMPGAVAGPRRCGRGPERGLHAAAVPEPGEPGGPPRDDGRGDLGATRTARSTSSWPASGRAGRSRAWPR